MNSKWGLELTPDVSCFRDVASRDEGSNIPKKEQKNVTSFFSSPFVVGYHPVFSLYLLCTAFNPSEVGPVPLSKRSRISTYFYELVVSSRDTVIPFQLDKSFFVSDSTLLSVDFITTSIHLSFPAFACRIFISFVSNICRY